MFAVKPGENGRPEIAAYCNMCGECVDACPGGALRYSILGRGTGGKRTGFYALAVPGNFLIFSALVMGGTFSALFAPASMHDIIILIRRFL